MSIEAPIGLKLISKVLGIVLIILGAIIAIYSNNPPEGDISQISGLFVLAGLVVAATGLFMLVAKNQ